MDETREQRRARAQAAVQAALVEEAARAAAAQAARRRWEADAPLRRAEEMRAKAEAALARESLLSPLYEALEANGYSNVEVRNLGELWQVRAVKNGVPMSAACGSLDVLIDRLT